MLLLLLAAIATFILAHINEINEIAAEKARLAVNTIKKERAQDPIRQAALNYEKHVESVGADK